MDLQCSEVVVLLFIVGEAADNEAEHLIHELLARVVVEEYDGFEVFPFEEGGLFDKVEFLVGEFVDNALEARLEVFLLVSEDKKIVLAFVFDVLKFDDYHALADAN